ncbi:FtsQ-type POTRA domain-containing protein [Frigoribacterium sp. CG_9.8]|uniref:FtsQ-type POTRA domain-containing protein n=1 Tax=Frigoribacterium sp. CG_9.8 TaxID=2787733 RepID=UPI0018CB0436|nr:FtsQ-type POTRA domain-containing protein [Frigoribacterium sp. CG_9.8]MBG6107873.1 cell division septal protein FtsQ [Frigoribacterium sp. CG_9.8]
MKRPEGFDRTPQSTTGATPPRKTPAQKKSGQKTPEQKKSGQAGQPPVPISEPALLKRRGRTRPAPISEQPADTAARHALKQAEKARRAYERGEARRFTRRSRRRRITWLVSGVSFLLVIGFVTGAVYSPLLSLTTIRIEGASRVSSSSVRAAVGDQIGRPLALVDFDSITRALGRFPLIRSFVTETVPPDTLIIRIAERVPIATLATTRGFSVVDPAGIVIDSAAERQPGFPLIELGSATVGSPAFTAAVGVVLALPPDLLKKVDTVSAQTADDVTLMLTGGQSVIWGSPEQSALKAKVLAAVITVGGATTKYDVSAPNHPVLGGN